MLGTKAAQLMSQNRWVLQQKRLQQQKRRYGSLQKYSNQIKMIGVRNCRIKVSKTKIIHKKINKSKIPAIRSKYKQMVHHFKMFCNSLNHYSSFTNSQQLSKCNLNVSFTNVLTLCLYLIQISNNTNVTKWCQNNFIIFKTTQCSNVCVNHKKRSFSFR